MSSDPKAPQFAAVKQWVPSVFAPGSTPAYSNYGASLAGYIVQRVSGETFDDYIDKHIFAPLDMKHSSFRQPLPADLVPLMSKGYPQASEPAKPFEIVGPAPAGSLASSGEDMAHFMIAHLQNGEYHGNRILKAETAEMMHNSPLTILPPLNRMELGFFETNINGREVIANLGDTQNLHSSLHLFLKENVGFYVSFNSLGKEGAAGGLRGALFEEFADRYFPAAETNAAKVDEKTAAGHAALLKGQWANSRGSQSSFLASVGLFGQTKLGVNGKGELVTPFKGLNGKPLHWVETAPFVWRDKVATNAWRPRLWMAKRRALHRRHFAVHGFRPRALVSKWSVAAAAAVLRPGRIGSDCGVLADNGHRATAFRGLLGVRSDELRARFSKIGSILIAAALGLWALTVIRMFSDQKSRRGLQFDHPLRAGVRHSGVSGGNRLHPDESACRMERAPLARKSLEHRTDAVGVRRAVGGVCIPLDWIQCTTDDETEAASEIEKPPVGAVSDIRLCFRGAGRRGRHAR